MAHLTSRTVAQAFTRRRRLPPSRARSFQASTRYTAKFDATASAASAPPLFEIVVTPPPSCVALAKSFICEGFDKVFEEECRNVGPWLRHCCHDGTPRTIVPAFRRRNKPRGYGLARPTSRSSNLPTAPWIFLDDARGLFFVVYWLKKIEDSGNEQLAVLSFLLVPAKLWSLSLLFSASSAHSLEVTNKVLYLKSTLSLSTRLSDEPRRERTKKKAKEAIPFRQNKGPERHHNGENESTGPCSRTLIHCAHHVNMSSPTAMMAECVA